jgi:hypothetical protein
MARNVILLRGDAHEESGLAVTYAITPGMLVEPVSTGFQPHATAGGTAAALYARQQSENDGASIDTDIAAADEVTVLFCEKGSKVNAVTNDTIVRGEFVQSAGDGTVALFDSGVIIGQATADSDLSGTVGRVEIVVI